MQRYDYFRYCDKVAVFKKFQSFDVTALRVNGTDEVVLNIEDFLELILYSY